ncbi:TPA: hypothetical protein ACX6PV_000839 [Photobacterium damselae]
MKKTIIAASVILSTLSAGAFAGVSDATGADTTNATMTWKADVPVVVPGQWITFTGVGGGAIAEGKINIEPSGAFSSSDVTVEVRAYDSATGTVGEGLVVGSPAQVGSDVSKVNVDSLTYTIDSLSFKSSEASHDLSSVMAQIKQTSANLASLPAGTLADIGTAYKVDSSDATGFSTSWAIQNVPGNGISGLVAGEEITAAAVIRADVNFA